MDVLGKSEPAINSISQLWAGIMVQCKCLDGVCWFITPQPSNHYTCCSFPLTLQTFRPKKKWEKGTLKYDLHKKAKVSVASIRKKKVFESLDECSDLVAGK